MKWKAFSQDEMVELRSNPYTLRVTDKTITFTLAFKEAFWDGLQAGISPITIISKLGYNSEILGYTRIWGISQHIRKEAESGEGFREGRHNPTTAISANEYGQLTNSRALQKMQNEIVYLRQEMEFLKKIMQADRGRGQKK